MATSELQQFLLSRRSQLSRWSLTRYPELCKYLVFQYKYDTAPSLFVTDLVISHKDDGFYGYVQNGAWNGLFRDDSVTIYHCSNDKNPRTVPGKIIWLGSDYKTGRKVFNMGVDEDVDIE